MSVNDFNNILLFVEQKEKSIDETLSKISQSTFLISNSLFLILISNHVIPNNLIIIITLIRVFKRVL